MLFMAITHFRDGIAREGAFTETPEGTYLENLGVRQLDALEGIKQLAAAQSEAAERQTRAVVEGNRRVEARLEAAQADANQARRAELERETEKADRVEAIRRAAVLYPDTEGQARLDAEESLFQVFREQRIEEKYRDARERQERENRAVEIEIWDGAKRYAQVELEREQAELDPTGITIGAVVFLFTLLLSIGLTPLFIGGTLDYVDSVGVGALLGVILASSAARWAYRASTTPVQVAHRVVGPRPAEPEPREEDELDRVIGSLF